MRPWEASEIFAWPGRLNLARVSLRQVGPSEEEAVGGAVATGDAGGMLCISGHAGRYPGSLTNDVRLPLHARDKGRPHVDLPNVVCNEPFILRPSSFKSLLGMPMDLFSSQAGCEFDCNLTQHRLSSDSPAEH